MKDSELRKAIELKSKKRKRKHSDQSEIIGEPAVIAKPTKLPSKKHKSNEQGNSLTNKMRINSVLDCP